MLDTGLAGLRRVEDQQAVKQITEALTTSLTEELSQYPQYKLNKFMLHNSVFHLVVKHLDYSE